MDTKSVTITPPYSLILLLDPATGVVPQSMNGQLIAVSQSCVAVGCRPEDDGPTTVILGSKSLVDPGREPFFACEIETPSRVLELQTALGATLATADVGRSIARLSVWVNDSLEPDKIIFGITGS